MWLYDAQSFYLGPPEIQSYPWICAAGLENCP